LLEVHDVQNKKWSISLFVGFVLLSGNCFHFLLKYFMLNWQRMLTFKHITHVTGTVYRRNYKCRVNIHTLQITSTYLSIQLNGAQHCTDWLQMVLILPVGWSANSGLSFTRCDHFHEKCLVRRASWNLCFVFFSIGWYHSDLFSRFVQALIAQAAEVLL
jgi:hypothetical protein